MRRAASAEHAARDADTQHELIAREVDRLVDHEHAARRRLPRAFQLDRALSKLAEHRDWQGLASFSYTIAMK